MTDWASRLWRKLFALEQWRIGVANVSVAQFLAAPQAVSFNWIGGARRAEILADPFAFETNGVLTIFAERLVHGRMKGELVQLGAAAGAWGVVSRRAAPFHLSYPFIACQNGTPFAIPEQAQSGRLEFYPVTGAGLAAPSASIEGFDAVDPTFLYRDGKWWLFCTRLNERPNEALHLYFADALTGPYTPHPQNPVVVDRTRARPAGRIVELEGKLLRPGQDCSTTYGGAITLSEIEILTPDRYRERTLRTLTPGMIQGAWPDGVHTLEHTQNHVLIDTKRFVFHPLAWALKLNDRLAGRSV